MPDTLTAFGVFLLAVLPDGLYVWSFERVVGRWGIGFADRVLRLVAASAVVLAVFAAPLHALWSELSEHREKTGQQSVARLGGYTGSKPSVKPKPPKSVGANVTPKDKNA